jgi:hypothetical protein
MMVQQYVLREFNSYGDCKTWLVEDDGVEIKKIKRLGRGEYNDKDGEVITYFDERLIDPQAKERAVKAKALKARLKAQNGGESKVAYTVLTAEWERCDD